MNRKVLLVQVAAIHLLVLGLLFGLMNGCERKRQDSFSLPSVSAPSRLEEPEEPGEIIEKEEPLVIKELGEPGLVKASEVIGDVEPASGGKVLEVKSGETLSGIAQDYGVSLKAILEENDIEDPAKIQVGQKITIPGI